MRNAWGENPKNVFFCIDEKKKCAIIRYDNATLFTIIL